MTGNMTFQEASRKALALMVKEFEAGWCQVESDDDLLAAATLKVSRGQTLSESSWVVLGAIGIQAARRLTAGSVDPGAIADDVLQLLASKRHDYGVENLAVWGQFGVAVRTLDKVHRLKHLLNAKSPRNESLLDSAYDIIGYAVCGWLLCADLWECELAPDYEQLTLPFSEP